MTAVRGQASYLIFQISNIIKIIPNTLWHQMALITLHVEIWQPRGGSFTTSLQHKCLTASYSKHDIVQECSPPSTHEFAKDLSIWPSHSIGTPPHRTHPVNVHLHYLIFHYFCRIRANKFSCSLRAAFSFRVRTFRGNSRKRKTLETERRKCDFRVCFGDLSSAKFSAFFHRNNERWI